MITRAFIAGLKAAYRSNAGLRRRIWRTWYNYLSRSYRTGDVTLLNYGYAPDREPEITPELTDAEARERLCIQLYDAVFTPALDLAAPIAARAVLEVGCGRGGGAAYLHRRYRPAAYTGVDFAAENIRFCRESHRAPGLEFEQGDAEALPFEDERFDVALNVESSHCYGSISRFFDEIRRVLKPGGIFSYADFRRSAEVRDVEGALAKCGFELVRYVELNEGVVRGLDQDAARREALIRENVPRPLRTLVRSFSGTPGAVVYEDFKNRRRIYFHFVLKKA